SLRDQASRTNPNHKQKPSRVDAQLGSEIGIRARSIQLAERSSNESATDRVSGLHGLHGDRLLPKVAHRLYDDFIEQAILKAGQIRTRLYLQLTGRLGMRFL